MIRKNQNTLKVGQYRLTEQLSRELYKDMNEWYMEEFGIEITFEQCQNILIEYDFIINWNATSGLEGVCECDLNEVFFYVTVTNPKVLNNQLKGREDFSFPLDTLLEIHPSPNDFFFKALLNLDSSQS